jgi:hypothetical protein
MRFLLPVLTTSLAVAQSVVLPDAATEWPGRWGNQTLFFHNVWSPGRANEARTQLVYALSEIPPTFTTVRALAFRTWGEPIATPAGTIQLDISMSTSAQDPNRPSDMFARNAGPSQQQVFIGPVTLPATPGGAWPQPWSIVVPLQTAFALAPAAGDRALVIDVRCWNSTAAEPWLVELYDVDKGLVEAELWQGDCLSAAGSPQLQWSVDGDDLIAGGHLGLLFGMYPGNHPSLHVNALALGLEGVGGTYLGLQMPFSLSVFGVPSPPNCRWSVNPLATKPMTYFTVGTDGFLDTELSLPIPNVPGVVGLRLVAQNAAMMQFPSGLQVFPSSVVALTIRSGALPSGSTVSAGGDRNATSGFPSYRRPIAIELR